MCNKNASEQFNKEIVDKSMLQVGAQVFDLLKPMH